MSGSLSARLSARYIRFAEEEAHGRSLLYERLARGVAADQDAIGFLLSLPQERQQPNLLLGAVRHLFGLQADWSHFRQVLLSNRESIATFMQAHTTQTNEPARCATLLPVLARLPQKLALIEVGASAGLCLLPDLYSYEFGGRLIGPSSATGPHPLFSCAASAATPIPTEMPQVVWRMGLDLNPLDVNDPAQANWLKTLVWPEQTQRLANLQAALDIAAVHKPQIVKGDLLSNDIVEICNKMPDNATRVVFHTAVLSYVVDQAARQAFAEQAKSLCDYWICNESPRVFPEFASRAKPSRLKGQFLLTVNGNPVAWTDPHGAALDWIADSDW